MIFCVLLRTVSCLALENSPLSIRLAKIEDIPSIRNCNLQNLPENYEDSFYLSHLRNWPGLAIIAETSESNLVGYCLGRVEIQDMSERPLPYSPPFDSTTKIAGHITSLAVNKEYRNQKVAYKLMQTLHYQMVHEYDADSISLHVRVSNRAATKLYATTFPYRYSFRIPGYYSDLEDAWQMTLPNLKLYVESEGMVDHLHPLLLKQQRDVQQREDVIPRKSISWFPRLSS
eukprot:gene11676-24456_t